MRFPHMLQSITHCLTLCVAISFLSSLTHGQQQPGMGVYRSADGQEQRWTIQDNSSLRWGNKTYVPSGVFFEAASISPDAPPTAWTQDQQAIDRIAAGGVSDVWVIPKAPVANASPTQIQRLVDYLESRNLNYGLSLGASGMTPAFGYSIRPANNRMAGLRGNMVATFRAPNAISALTVFVDQYDKTPSTPQTVAVSDGVGRFGLPGISSQEGVLLIYPQGILSTESGWLPDVWRQHDAWRDKTIAVLRQVKFGPRLRFLSDPLGEWTLPESLTGMWPDSPMFRVAFEAWLTRRYQSIENLMSAWAMTERNLDSYAAAARLMPLWNGAKGLPILWDEQTRVIRHVETARCAYWTDMQDFLHESLQNALNRFSGLLRRTVVDVPVLLSWNRTSRVLVDLRLPVQWDGFIARTTALGAEAAGTQMAHCTAQSRENVRPMLLFSAPKEPLKGDAAAPGLVTPLARRLADAGARGLFLNATSSDTPLETASICQKAGFTPTDGERPAPSMLFYPAEAAALIDRSLLPSGVWWVPSVRPGAVEDMGANYRGYRIQRPGGLEFVIWCVEGDRRTSFRFAEPRVITARNAAGQEEPMTSRRNVWTLTIGPNPVVLTGSDGFFPVESATDSVAELARGLKIAQDRRREPAGIRFRLQQAQDNLNKGQAYSAYLLASEGLRELLPRVAGFIWREAEDADETNFDEVFALPWASGMRVLSLNNVNDPPARGYYVRYSFEITSDTTYNLWVASRIDNASSWTWSLDDGSPSPPKDGNPVGGYAGMFGWLRLGSVRMAPGKHTLEIKVTRRVGGVETPYSQMLDSILITSSNALPMGSRKPGIE